MSNQQKTGGISYLLPLLIYHEFWLFDVYEENIASYSYFAKKREESLNRLLRWLWIFLFSNTSKLDKLSYKFLKRLVTMCAMWNLKLDQLIFHTLISSNPWVYLEFKCWFVTSLKKILAQWVIYFLFTKYKKLHSLIPSPISPEMSGKLSSIQWGVHFFWNLMFTYKPEIYFGKNTIRFVLFIFNKMPAKYSNPKI